MRRLKLIGIGLIPLLMTYCHATVTGPRLWSHNSSAAFDTFIAFYMLNVILMLWAIVFAFSEWKRK